MHTSRARHVYIFEYQFNNVIDVNTVFFENFGAIMNWSGRIGSGRVGLGQRKWTRGHMCLIDHYDISVF